MTSSKSLRDTIAANLASLPNATRLGVTVASSTPKKTSTLFPYVSPASSARSLESEHLVVVHCGLSPAATTSSSTDAAPLTDDVLAAAIAVNVYTIKDTSIVYISKVDSSGYASSAGRLTRELAISVLLHFLSVARPSPRVIATLFARSQGQYLFPNSIEGGGKRILGGLGLCQWWKGVYEETTRRIVDSGLEKDKLKLRYLMPSYSAAEAKGMLRAPTTPPPVEWEYAPPFIPLNGESLALLIPSLPDDPKTRFLDELAGEALDSAPRKGKEQKDPGSPKKRKKEQVEDEEDRKVTHAALAKVPPEEFWERLGFRQECTSGDVTGFFAMDVGGDTCQTTTAHSLPPTLVERLLKSLLNTDFGTRALAADGTKNWLESTRRLVVDEIGEAGWEACTASIEAKGDIDTGERKRKEEIVTVLQPRKKKK